MLLQQRCADFSNTSDCRLSTALKLWHFTMSKESKQEQLRQLLAANDLSTEDTQQGVNQAQAELIQLRQTLQQQSKSPSLPQRAIKTINEDCAALQRIIDLSHEISQLDVVEGGGADDEVWKGRLEIPANASDGKRGFALRVSHDAARALHWQVACTVHSCARATTLHNSCAGCNPGQSHRQALQSELLMRAPHHASAWRR